MSERKLCVATTKAGNPCKNSALDGSDFCRVHQSLAMESPAAQPDETGEPTAAGLTDEERAEFRQLIQQLNELADELKQMDMGFRPPRLSVSGLVALVEENLYRFTPTAQREIIDTLRASFQGTRPEDLKNPETWKGFWYVLNFMAQNQKNELEAKLLPKLMQIPGFAVLNDLRMGLQQAEPKDFLEPDTWKGLAYLLRHSTQLQIEQMKNRILGKEE